MRHADSTDRADQQTKDHERSITDLGRQAAAQVMLLVQKLQCRRCIEGCCILSGLFEMGML